MERKDPDTRFIKMCVVFVSSGRLGRSIMAVYVEVVFLLLGIITSIPLKLVVTLRRGCWCGCSYSRSVKWQWYWRKKNVVEKLCDSKRVFVATELFTRVGGTWVSC